MTSTPWWQRSVLYEIFVPSFQDSNGDGFGDLPGILQRLEYLANLGIGTLWLSPFYCSEMYDAGYDVTDHTSVDSRFGTLADFDQLLSAVHDCGLRLVIDYVPNHTSVQHSWFRQSRFSRTDAKRDWYLWADPSPGGGPPNNWINRFGRSAWSFDTATEQYYFGTFSPQQPDLNWRNEQVQQAQFDVLRYWLDRGVDGVRVDALPHLIKDLRLRDNPKNLSYSADQEPSNLLVTAYSANQPELLGLIRRMRQVLDEYDDRVLIGEAYEPIEQLAAYQRAGIDVPLNTSLLTNEFAATSLRVVMDRVEAITPQGSCPSWTAGNHDIPRLAERVGANNLRLAALLHLTARGAASCYYGDELGLPHLDVAPAEMQDPSGRDDPRYSRDRMRTPMPWSRLRHAGFSTHEPWLPIDTAAIERNVADQLKNADSLLRFYQRVLRMRAEEQELQSGAYRPLDLPEPIIAFLRGESARGLLIALNISDEPATLALNDLEADLLLSTASTSTRLPDLPIDFPMRLEAREGIVARIVGAR